jgi:hypothetical protein
MRILAAMRKASASETEKDVLVVIAAELRAEDTVISDHVTEPTATPILGPFVASGPRCVRAPAEYAQVIESIREGYLLHYGAPRVLAGLDEDLALLAGDHLYALGLERLAGLGDLDAVRELADLISLCSQIGDAGGSDDGRADAAWLAAVTAVAAGGGPEHDAAKASLRRADPGAPSLLRAAAGARAAATGLGPALAEVAEAIESGSDGLT